MTLAEVANLLAAISGIYSTFRISEQTCECWHAVLEPYPYERVMQAAKQYFGSPSEFAPVPGKLIEILQHDVRESFLPAAAAWEAGLALASPYRAHLRDGLPSRIQILMRRLGWERIHMADVHKDLPWIQREFIRLYENEVEDEIRHNTPGLLLRMDKMALPGVRYPERNAQHRPESEVLRKVSAAVAGGTAETGEES